MQQLHFGEIPIKWPIQLIQTLDLLFDLIILHKKRKPSEKIKSTELQTFCLVYQLGLLSRYMPSCGIIWSLWASQVVLVKNPAANAGDRISSRFGLQTWSLGRCPGEGHGNPLQYSCLENPMDRRGWRATVHGVVQSQATLHKCTHGSFIFSIFRNLHTVLHSGWTNLCSH